LIEVRAKAGLEGMIPDFGGEERVVHGRRLRPHRDLNEG